MSAAHEPDLPLDPQPADQPFPATRFEATAIAGQPPVEAGPAPAGNGLPLGTRLAEFELTRLVGEGGFGLVYEAYDHALQRRVALKEYMPSSLAARGANSQVGVKSERHRDTFQAGLKSFVNEARLLASFDHPALVRVYRFWEANGTAYMVMPFLEGLTLKQRLRELAVPPDEAWLHGVLQPVTEALMVIHAQQCYHRDIAPDNIMQTAGNQHWLLLDFGAARRVIGDMTQALTVILKPGYAPVEQYAEVPGMKQGAWTDVYALAAVVYSAITGRTPPPSVGRLLNDTYQPLAQLAEGRYSPGFLAAVDRALAVRPEARTPSIAQFRDELGLRGHHAPEAYTAYSTRPLPVGEVPARPPAPGPLPAPEFTVQMPLATAPLEAAAPAVAHRPAGAARARWVAVGVAALGVVGALGYVFVDGRGRPVAPDTPPPATASSAVPAVVATPTLAPALASAQTSAPAVPARFDPFAEFAKTVQGQTPGPAVRVVAERTQLRIGRDVLRFSVSSERAGYLQVFVAAADGALVQVVPAAQGRPVVLNAGQTFQFPAAGFQSLDASEPPGPGQVLAVVSASPRTHGAVLTQVLDQMRLFPSGGAALAALQAHRGAQAWLVGQAECGTAAACDTGYAAAVLNVDVVR